VVGRIEMCESFISETRLLNERHSGAETSSVHLSKRHQQRGILRRFVENESVPIQLAQCWFPGLAISSANL